MGYEEHLDYDIIQSTNTDFNNAVIRVNIRKRVAKGEGKQLRQTVMYISPMDGHLLLGQAELLAIDEAAAIPLPIVSGLINSGPYPVFMSSTINGYEGTGRSLSLKLINTLRASKSRSLLELDLKEPIRYALNDPVERWLNELLCLDCASSLARSSGGSLPHPDQCSLFQVNRDTLFSYHRASELFLQRLMALFVASHYKNSPNDLQLLADAPGHRLFVLLGPVKDSSSLPDIVASIQVAFEGHLTRETALAALQKGKRDAGDLIPWTMANQFLDGTFGELSGVRVVRIAVHPEMQSMGYGKRALALLEDYLKGTFGGQDEPADEVDGGNAQREKGQASNEEDLQSGAAPAPRAHLDPLLVNVTDLRVPEELHWIGTSYGLTQPLYRFWSRSGYEPVYLRQSANEITGEHTVIMLKALSIEHTREGQLNPGWLREFVEDFKTRFVGLLSAGCFRAMAPSTALSILQGVKASPGPSNGGGASSLRSLFSPHDLHRLEAAGNNNADLHLVSDLVPLLARLHFAPFPQTGLHSDVSLSPVQASIFLSLGLQARPISDLHAELATLTKESTLAMMIKVLRKFVKVLQDAFTDEGQAQQQPSKQSLDPFAPAIDQDLDQELVAKAQRSKGKPSPAAAPPSSASPSPSNPSSLLLSSLDLKEYEIDSGDDNLEQVGSLLQPGAIISLKKKQAQAKARSTTATAGKHENGAKDSRDKRPKPQTTGSLAADLKVKADQEKPKRHTLKR